MLVAGCAGGAFNGIGARNSTLEKVGNEKYTAGGKKVNTALIMLADIALTNGPVLPHL